MGLILDSSVVIASERCGETVERLIERVVGVTGDQEVALSAIGLTELIHGSIARKLPRLRRLTLLLIESCSSLTSKEPLRSV